MSFRTRFRIADTDLGYQIQYKYWWWPLWRKAPIYHCEREGAERLVRRMVGTRYSYSVEEVDLSRPFSTPALERARKNVELAESMLANRTAMPASDTTVH